MRQVDVDPPSTTVHPKHLYPELFAVRRNSYGGFDYQGLERNTFDDSEEERLNTYEELWADGSFRFQLGGYPDMIFDDKANTAAYNFWRDKTRAKILDPRVADLLAPMRKPYAFGCKRIPLEIGYFECFNQPHVELIDVRSTPVVEVTENGIRTSEKEMQFDYIVCATGYDSFTGGLTQIDIRGLNNCSLKEYWSKGCNTYLGMSIANFPNLFFSYGPQAPTALCNGPSCAELQGDWIHWALQYARKNGVTKMVAKEKSAESWRGVIDTLANSTLLPTTESVSVAALKTTRLEKLLTLLSGIWAITSPANLDRLCSI
jgi:cation diffusion facilitator CzcD-associated flavoprotein CzcO